MSEKATWDGLVDRMLQELAHDGPRAESYWAQQMAFGPVFVHAVGLRLRREPVGFGGEALVRCAQLARAAFGSLPEPPACDPTGLRMLAARQARALGWRRRAALDRLLQRLGARATEHSEVPARLTRCHELIGFRPGERLAG
ncbi:MAG: hypothetical protein FJ265_15530 [Planctomycetes bacterium]|nr:hypothetical protein [Planctomycetota bacterium]